MNVQKIHRAMMCSTCLVMAQQEHFRPRIAFEDLTGSYQSPITSEVTIELTFTACSVAPYALVSCGTPGAMESRKTQRGTSFRIRPVSKRGGGRGRREEKLQEIFPRTGSASRAVKVKRVDGDQLPKLYIEAKIFHQRIPAFWDK